MEWFTSRGSPDREKEKKKDPRYNDLHYVVQLACCYNCLAMGNKSMERRQKGGLESCVKGRVETSGDEDLTADK